MHVSPGITMEAAMGAGPGVLRQSRMSIVLDVRLGRHVLHFLKHVTRLWCYKDLKEHYFEWSTIVMGEFHMDQMNPHSGLYKSFVDLPSF